MFNLADTSMGLMATINLIAIVALSGTVAKLTRDYLAPRKAGKMPTFHLSEHPGIGKGVDAEIWR